METASPALYHRLGGRPRLQQLLRHFYADVRQHALIGPVFAAQIDDWPAHLEKIADFWSNLTGGPVLYRGGMAARHFPLALEAQHFDAWLELWRRHCRIHLPAPEAEEMIQLAETMRDRLQSMIAMQRAQNAPPQTN